MAKRRGGDEVRKKKIAWLKGVVMDLRRKPDGGLMRQGAVAPQMGFDGPRLSGLLGGHKNITDDVVGQIVKKLKVPYPNFNDEGEAEAIVQEESTFAGPRIVPPTGTRRDYAIDLLINHIEGIKEELRRMDDKLNRLLNK